MNEPVTFTIARSGLPPLRAGLYDYVFAGNGTFVRGRRPGLQVMLPIAAYPVRGLPEVVPFVQLTYPPVPAALVEAMLVAARQATDGQTPVESLFHLVWQPHGWELHAPPQARGWAHVRPLEPCPTYAQALIEVHSHHGLPARFSSVDDADETGFRIYGVLGTLFERPTLGVRVGLYGHFWAVPADWVFNLPAGVTDALAVTR